MVRIPPSLGNSAACGWCYQSRMLIAIIHGLGILPSPGVAGAVLGYVEAIPGQLIAVGASVEGG